MDYKEKRNFGVPLKSDMTRMVTCSSQHMSFGHHNENPKEAQQKQLQLDRLIADEKDRATEHEKTMEKLHTLEISDEEKATLLQEAQRSLDQSNIDLHELEKKLLEELANERAAVNKFKAESDEAKQQWDETEKSRRQIAGKLDNAARRNDDLSKRTFLSFFFVFFVFCFLFFVFCFLFFVFCFCFLFFVLL